MIKNFDNSSLSYEKSWILLRAIVMLWGQFRKYFKVEIIGLGLNSVDLGECLMILTGIILWLLMMERGITSFCPGCILTSGAFAVSSWWDENFPLLSKVCIWRASVYVYTSPMFCWIRQFRLRLPVVKVLRNWNSGSWLLDYDWHNFGCFRS